MKSLSALLTLCILAPVLLWSQKKTEYKFSKITPADFNITSQLIDSNANAIILADIGSSRFEGNTKGWFSLIFKKTIRIKILNKKGFDAGNVSIPLYSKSIDLEERLTDCKGSTYNLINGAVQKTDLEQTQIFKEKTRRYWVKKKFTMPNVTVGSIIEYSYTITSDFLFNLQPWSFQSEYPCLLSRYNVTIPEFFRYINLATGYIPITAEKKEQFQTYSVIDNNGVAASDRYTISGSETSTVYWAENIPAFVTEPYTSSMDNHLAKIEFQLARIQFSSNPPTYEMASYGKMAKQLLEDEEFGYLLSKDNNWLNNDMKEIVGQDDNMETKAKKIFKYLRDKFTVTANSIYLTNNLKDVVRKGSGSIGDINLLLIAMLRHENIPADPVLISTRGNEFVNSFYPIMERFNYVICRCNFDDKTVYLDASDSKSGFGKMNSNCYNGTGFVVTEIPDFIRLDTDSLNEYKASLIIARYTDKGYEGSYYSHLGTNESHSFREKLSKSNKEEIFKQLQKGYMSGTKFSNMTLDSLTNYDYPIDVKYDFKTEPLGEDIIYINPMLSEGYTINPFSSLERKYPVEMPYCIKESYTFTIEIPKEYMVEEIPKSARVMLNDDEGKFEYFIQKDNEKIMLRSLITIGHTLFSPEDYATLRDFFGYIVKKHAEQIVLKKIK